MARSFLAFTSSLLAHSYYSRTSRGSYDSGTGVHFWDKALLLGFEVLGCGLPVLDVFQGRGFRVNSAYAMLCWHAQALANIEFET